MPKPKRDANTIANRMLELHLKHDLAFFDEDAFIGLIENVYPHLYEWLQSQRIEDFVTADMIKDVIQRNVVEHEVPGTIAELAGEAADALFSSDRHMQSRLKDIVAPGEFEEIVSKLLEMKEQRQNGLDHIIDQPIYKELISGILYKAIVRYIYETNLISKNVPGVANLMKFGKNMVHKTMPKLEDAVEENIRSFIGNNLGVLLKESKAFLEESLTDEELKASALEFWDLLENKTMEEFQQGMDSVDLSEFVVMGYEFWLRFRKTPYFQHAYITIVDYLFDKFGQETVATMMDELAITQQRVVTEARAFAPSILHTLKSSGQLEAMLRARLESFYFSNQALSCLAE